MYYLKICKMYLFNVIVYSLNINSNKNKVNLEY